ncbi:MAG: LysR family transcriptional regulator, partial [Peptococcaceae bacterium]|nr:LysR family transcriptional regulator [Peptococcaceae bacterium]
SVAIKKLEKELGLQLLERTYRGVRLTADGEKVVELASKAFAYFDEIESLSHTTVKTSNTPNLNDITIYTNPAFNSLLSTAIAENTEQFRLEMHPLENTTDPYSLVSNNPNCIVLTNMNESTAIPPDIRITLLSKSKLYVMCSQDFTYIPQGKNTISFKELLQVPLITVKESFELQDTILRILNLYGTPKIKANTIDIFSMTAMVNGGLGASFGVKIMHGKEYNDMRYIAIRNAPQFMTVLLYDKTLPEDKISLLTEILKPHII